MDFWSVKPTILDGYKIICVCEFSGEKFHKICQIPEEVLSATPPPNIHKNQRINVK